MPTLYAPVRLHAQENHSYRADDVLILSMSYEGTYPKVLVLQPNRREQVHLRGRSNTFRTIGQMDYRVWEAVQTAVHGRLRYFRVGHSIHRRIQVSVAPANTGISAVIRQVLPAAYRNDVNTPRMLQAPPWGSVYDDMLIVKVEY